MAPLLAQTAALQPVVYNLEYPIQTFLLGLTAVEIAIATHFLYVQSSVLSVVQRGLRVSVYRPLGLLRVPGLGELLLLGCMGALATILTSQYGDAPDAATGIGPKILQAFRPLIVAPACALAPELYGGRSRLPLLGVVLYLAALLAVGAAANARSTISYAILTIALMSALLFISGQWVINRRNWGRVVLLIVVAALLIPLVSRMSSAIISARTERTSLSQSELFSSTFRAFFDPSLTDPNLVPQHGRYSEEYLSSQFLNRLVVVKFTDNVYAEAADFSASEIAQVHEDFSIRTTAALPGPFLSALGIEFDKESLKYSSGDVYAKLGTRYPRLGAFLSGSSLADGFVLFGFTAIPLFAMICLATFTIQDSFLVPNSGGNAVPQMPVVVMISLWQTFLSALYSDSFAGLLVQLVRNFPQAVLVTALALACTRMLTYPFASVRALAARKGKVA
jgi:hypothetical protein